MTASVTRIFWRSVIAAFFALAAIATAQYFRAVRPHVGSVDFFYYVCYARDMLAGEPVNAGAYSYFPGVYLFWRSAMRLVGTQLEQLQQLHLVVLLITGFMTAAIVYQLTGRGLLAGVSLFFYWVWASRFEGFAAVTEPVASLFFLLGLWSFAGQPLRGSAGWRRALLCGVAWGFSVYLKQQAGLLTLGYAALVIGTLRFPRHDGWPQLLCIPISAAITLVAGILLEQRGLAPLSQGLLTASGYPPEGTWWSNLYVQIRHDESAALAAVLCAGAVFVASYPSAGRKEWPPWLRLLQVAGVGALASLWQFTRRPYGHYALLAIPILVIVYWTIVGRLSAELTRRYPWARWLGSLLVLLALTPLFYTGGNPNNLHVWQWRTPDLSGLALWHEQPQVHSDLQRVAAVLQRADRRVFVLPPYRNDIFYLTGIQASPALGYGFQLLADRQFPWTEMQYVVIARRQFDTHPERLRYDEEMRPLIDELSARGFRRVLHTKSLEVFESGRSE